MKTILLSFIAGLCFMQAAAQNDSAKLNYLSLEFDPAPFILGGYSVSLKYSNKNLPHFTVMGSVYGSGFPDRMMNKTNAEKGWTDLKIEPSTALFTDYFIRSDRKGFHWGPSVFLYNKTVGLSGTAERIRFQSIYPNIRAGYVYQPFKKSGFYINPWVNFGKEMVIGGKTAIGETRFSQARFQYIIAVHLAYSIRFACEK